MELRFARRLDAPADIIWSLIGDGFGEVGQWSRGLAASRLKAPGDGMRQGAIRLCEMPNGQVIEEEARLYDPTQMHLRYAVVAGAPAWAQKASNDWSIIPDGAGCLVTAHVVLPLPWWLWPLAPLLRLWIHRLAERFIADLQTTAAARPRAA